MSTRSLWATSSSCGVLYAARYAHICRAQVATSRARERRVATHRPTGAANAIVCVTSGGALTRLRTSGAATPAATTPQAAALIRLERRTGLGVYVRIPSPSPLATSVCPRSASLPRPVAIPPYPCSTGLRSGPLAAARGCRRLHEGIEDRARLVRLRMPLDPQHELLAR